MGVLIYRLDRLLYANAAFLARMGYASLHALEEAGGLDAVSAVVEQMRARGDEELTLFFDSQLADEILHVRYANEYIRRQIRQDPRMVLRMGGAMTEAAKAFKQVMGSEGTEGVSYAIDRQARLEGGFTDEEVNMAMQAAGAPQR